MKPQEAKQLLKETVSEGGELDLRYENAKSWIYEQIKQAALGGYREVYIPVHSHPLIKEKALSSFGLQSELAVLFVSKKLHCEGYDVKYPNMSLTPSIIIIL
jgi:hypothetical protein